MSSLEVSGPLEAGRKYDKSLLDAVMRPVVGNKPSSPETSTFEDTLHLLGKGEEVTAKLLGQVFTDDDKYEDAFGSSDYWSQVGFYELFKDAGIDQENLGTAGPTLAAVLGLAAAIANPIDPLNKLKVLGLTKQGIAGKRLGQALDAGADTLTKKGDFTVINEALAGKRVAQLEKDLATGALSGDVAKHARTSLKEAKKSVADIDEVNKMLLKLQKKGMSIDDIRLADTRLERIRRGQQNALGWSSPLSMDHLGMFGAARSEMANASVSPLVPGTQKIEASLVKGISEIGGAVGDVAATAGKGVLDKMGLRIIESQKNRALLARIKQIIRYRQGNVALYKEDMTALRREYGLSREEFLEVINRLEEGNLPDALVMKDIVAEMPESVDPTLRSAKSVKELSEEEAESLGVRFGSRLTKEDELILTPSGIDPKIDLPKAVEQFSAQADYPSWQFNNGDRFQLTGEFAIIEPATEASSVADINALNKAIGQRTYVKTKGPQGQDLLVARRLPGATPMSNVNMFEYQHLDNLEALLSKLALQQKSLKSISPEDILINPLGGVQLVNPDKVVQFTGKGASSQALTNSRNVLELFLDDNTLVGKGGGLRDFPFLKSLKTAKRAPRVATARRVRDGHDADSQNVHDLLNEAVNVGTERELLRAVGDGVNPFEVGGLPADPNEFLRVNDIEQAYRHITSQIAKGEMPTIKPITVSVDARGNLFVVEGSERAVAAAMAGMDVVPTTTKKLYGETLNLKKTHYVGRTLDAKEFFHGAEAGRAIARSGALEDAGLQAPSIISPNYKIIDEAGNQFGRLNDTEAFQTQSAAAVLSSVGGLSTAGLRSGRGLNERPQLLARKLAEIYGDEGSAAAAVSNLVMSSNGPSDFAAKLHQALTPHKAGQLSGRNGVLKTANTRQTVEDYGRLREASNANLEELSSKGLICNACIGDPKHREIFLEANPGKSLVVLDEASNTITYANYGRDADRVNELANASFNAVGGAEEIAPHTKIRMISRQGDQVTDITKEARDFVATPHPKLAETINIQAEGVIEPEELARLREEHGVIRNPTTEDGVFLQGDAGSIGVPLQETERGLRRQTIPFFMTRAGDLFVTTKYQDLRGLVGSVFGRGPRFMQESGVITPRGIVLDNPMGALMPQLGASEVKALQRRIRDVAGKLSDMGVNHGMHLNINVPFDGGVWSRMYGDQVTLGQVLGKGWKLDIPDLLKDMPLDLTVETSQRVVRTREPRFKSKKVQQLFEKLRDDFDAQFVEEFMNSVSSSFHASYFPRFATKEAKDAFNAAGMDYVHASPKVVRHIEPFLKQRVFTDLTTPEINEIVEIFSQKKAGISPEGLLEEITKHAREKFGKELSLTTAERFLALVDIMPSGVKFFHDDAIHAGILRFQSGQRALQRAETVKTLEDAGVMWSGTPSDLQALFKGREDTLRPLEADALKLREEIANIEGQLKAHLDTAPDVPEPKRVNGLRKSLDEKKVALAEAEAKVSRTYEKFVGNNGVVADRIDRGQIFISGDDAERLISKGVLNPELLPNGVDDTLVRVPFESVVTNLGTEGVRIHAFDPEVAGLAKRLFGLETKQGFGKFLKAWDHMHDLWRTYTLFPIISFHARNALSSFTMNYLGGITAPRTYEDTMKVFGILSSKNKGRLTLAQAREGLDSLEYFNSIGQRATARDLWEEFVRRGGPQGGLYVNEYTKFGNLKRADEATRLGIQHGLVPSSEAAGSLLFDNKLIRGGLKLGTAIESRMRFAAFLETWQKSGSFDAAERAVKAIHYDYSDLSAFERDVLRRVIPFYSWSRHNIPAMFRTMVTNPVEHLRILRMVHQVEQGATGRVPPDEAGIPEYIREKFGVILHKGADGKYFMKVAEGIFPIFDAYKILGGSAMEVIGQGVTPFAKFPIEQLANHSFFTGRSIENFSGEPSTRRFTLGEAGFTRRVSTQGPLSVANIVANDSVVRDFFRIGSTAANLLEDFIDPKNWVEGEPTVGVALWDLLLGRGKVVDPEKTRAAIAFKRSEMLNHLKRAKKYYGDVGNDWLAGHLDERIMNFVLEHGGNPDGR